MRVNSAKRWEWSARTAAQGCPVVLLDWNVFHVDHEDRFDAVPYVEYDFENVHRYFSGGWTKAQATLVEIPRRPMSWNGELAKPTPGPGWLRDVLR